MADNEGKGEIKRVLGRSLSDLDNGSSANSNIEEPQVQINTPPQTEQNNADNEAVSKDDNLDEYISQILNANISENEYINDSVEKNIEADSSGYTISQQFNPNPVQNTPQTSDIITFLKQHIQVVTGVILVVLIVIILANLEEPSSTTYTPNVTEPEQTERNYNNINTIPASTKQDIKQKNIQQAETMEKPAKKVQPKPVEKVVPVKTQSAPTGQYVDPNVYLTLVQRQLQSSFNQYGNSASVDCSMLVEPSGSIKKLKDDWNADVAYNFLSINRSAIPKFVDKQGNAIPLIVNFSGHSINVKFQYPPKMTTETPKPVQKSNTVNKTDLQKSQDWFFE